MAEEPKPADTTVVPEVSPTGPEVKYTLTSSDDEVFEVRKDVASMSLTIKNMLEDMGEVGGETPIPLPNVSSKILKMVVDFCNHHYDAKTPPREEKKPWENPTIELKGYDLELSERLTDDLPTLFDLILAANYLDIKTLMDVACQTVANKIIGKTTEELRAIFNIVNDFTPEEEEQVRKDNEWCFPKQ